ncbi:MAG: hypothetical protein QNJ14_13235 [Woeseiaceae bacterium]|nr:hypothetical protein [Woeseiaceae bacterium]
MRISLTLVLLAAAAVLPSRAVAFDLEENLRTLHEQYESGPALVVAQRDGMSLSEATAMVRRSLKPGDRIVKAETKVQGGREVHHFRIVTKDGRVRTRTVNGRRR